MHPDTDDQNVLTLFVSLSPPGGDDLILRMSPEVGRDVVQLLDQGGIEHSTHLQASLSDELVIEGVRILEGGSVLTSLAAIINTVLKRHDGKRVVFENNGEKTEISGLSEKAIDRLLEKRAEELAERNADWERQKKNEPTAKD